MHALVNQGNGKYYVSYVFGYYTDITATDEYERYVQSIHSPYFIVWDENKQKLIKWLRMVPNTNYLIQQIIIVDRNRDNWIIDDEGEGCVNFLSKEIIDSIVDEEKQPADIIEKCRNIDVGYTYNEYTEIKTDEGVKNFVIATGEFHDARIIKEIMQADGTLYLRFDGIWGCEVEVWFWGELEYDTSVRHIENLDPYWSCSTLMIKDGFIYFVDEFFEEEELSLDLIKQGEYCYFKAQHMKYHIIPN